MRRVLTVCLLLLATAVEAATPASPMPAVPVLEFEKYQLANGLEVILVEDHRLPLVAVNLWYHVGPANEKPGRTGFAHLFEHMMFQGSKNVPGDSHFRLLEGAGATDANGTTGYDRTNYFETLPANQLELALWLESDRMGFLLETVDQEKLSNQQDVVRNERRQSLENTPYGLVREGLFHTLFPKGHPYYASIIGSHADIEAVQLDDVRDFFREYYAPNNASIAIVGDIDKARTRELVEKYFGSIPAGKPVEKLQVETPPITAERRAVFADRVELPRVYMAWITPAIYQPGDAEADLIAHILGGGKASRLYRKLVHEMQIAQSVSVSQSSLTLGSVFTIEATARPGVKPAQLEDAIDAELAKLRQLPPTAAEVDAARNEMVSGIIRGLETLGGFGGVADRLNGYNHYLGDPDFLQQDIARYARITPQSLREAAAQMLRPQARVVVHGVPGDKVINDPARGTRAAANVAIEKSAPDWRASTPAPGPASGLALPVPEQFRLANGLTVLLYPQHRLPVIAANLTLLAGSDHNPASKPGLANFTADMLDEGTRTRSNLQIAQELSALGAELAVGSSTDASALSLQGLSHNVDQTFSILADVALNPAFLPEEIERVRSSRLTQIIQQDDNPTAVAQRVFNTALYGDKHPYGFIELGTAQSVQGITRDDLTAFWRGGYTPGNAVLSVAGDIDLPTLRVLAEKHFGAWRGAAVPAAVAPMEAPSAGRILIIDRGAAPQTALRMGQVGAPRSSPDYVPLTLMNSALGGLFSSRISLNLRERNGFTYGARSGFAFRRGAGPFTVASSVRSDATAAAVKEVFNEITRMRDEPITADELTLSRDAFARSLPGLFETSGDSAATGSTLFVYGLPLDYYAALPAKLDAVTIADVQRVAKEYLVPERIVTVAVGDRSSMEAELKALAIAPVEVRVVQ